MVRSGLHCGFLAVALSGCSASVLTTPRDPLIQDQMTSMHDFEAWLGGFRARLADPSPEVARDCASEALFVLRNPDLWSARELAPSIVERERFLQIARWEGQRAVRGLPKDMRALSALSEIDALAGDREGAAWARCRAADVAAQSFSAQAACASALASAGHQTRAVSFWRRAFPLADRDGQSFYVLHELEQEGQGKLLTSFPADVVARYRALIAAGSPAPQPPAEWQPPPQQQPQAQPLPPPTAAPYEAPPNPTPVRQAVRPPDASPSPSRLGEGGGTSSDSD